MTTKGSIYRAVIKGGDTTPNPDHLHVFFEASDKLEATDNLYEICRIFAAERMDYEGFELKSEEELKQNYNEGSMFHDDHLVMCQSLDAIDNIDFVREALILLAGQKRMRLKLALLQGINQINMRALKNGHH